MAVINLVSKNYSDAEYVEGVYKCNHLMERALHYHCKRYFDQNYRGVFFIGNDHKDEIFQEAFIKLWENIMARKLYVEDGVLKGKDGKPFSGKLTTYFMKIAKLKFLEWVRKNLHRASDEDEERAMIEQEMDIFKDILYDSDDEVMLEIIADCISHMSKRCNQILTMFYYEEKTLDDIMDEIPEFNSRRALITRHYKCLKDLRNAANSIYDKYLNA